MISVPELRKESTPKFPLIVDMSRVNHHAVDPESARRMEILELPVPSVTKTKVVPEWQDWV